MAKSAALLVDEALPEQPLRQWVLSVPYPLRFLFASPTDVREATYCWMLEYNEERPHDSPSDRTPAKARQQAAGNSTIELST
jgi:hypothetical protein